MHRHWNRNLWFIASIIGMGAIYNVAVQRIPFSGRMPLLDFSPPLPVRHYLRLYPALKQ